MVGVWGAILFYWSFLKFWFWGLVFGVWWFLWCWFVGVRGGVWVGFGKCGLSGGIGGIGLKTVCGMLGFGVT